MRRNKAGRPWRLKPDLGRGMLVTGPDNPYFESQPVSARDFTLIYKTNAGTGGAKIIGFKFLGEFYRKD